MSSITWAWAVRRSTGTGVENASAGTNGSSVETGATSDGPPQAATSAAAAMTNTAPRGLRQLNVEVMAMGLTVETQILEKDDHVGHETLNLDKGLLLIARYGRIAVHGAGAMVIG